MKNLGIFIISFVMFASCGQAQENQNDPSKAIHRDVNVTSFEKLMQEKDNEILLDVRTPEETEQGKIEGAKEINFFSEDFRQQINKLDKEKPVMVYCASGGRSGKTMNMMKEMGFEEVYNLKNGYGAWKEKH